jgi:hypothetical protein
VERAARELRAAVRAIVRSEGTGPPPGTAQREQLAFLLQRQPGEGEAGPASAGGKGAWRKGRGAGGGAGASVVDAVGESKEVTRSLARTRELMAQELRRMGGVVEVIGAW